MIYGPGEYGYESDWDKPRIRPGWVLIRVAYAGICGSDITRFKLTGSYKHPMILGHEFSGTVELPAPGSNKYKYGDPVAVSPIIPCGKCEGCLADEPFHCNNYKFIGSRNDGGFAEFCLVPEENLLLLDSLEDLKKGALAEPILVALHTVHRSKISPGKNAIVFGAGPIGLLISLWLKEFGANKVVVADIRESSLRIAGSLGIKNTINLASSDLSSEERFDFAYEAAGSNKALIDAIAALRDKGSLTLTGRDSKDTLIPLKMFEAIIRKELTIVGSYGYKIKNNRNLVDKFLRCKSFDLHDLITHEVSLEDSSELITQMAEKSIEYCKVIIKM